MFIENIYNFSGCIAEITLGAVATHPNNTLIFLKEAFKATETVLIHVSRKKIQEKVLLTSTSFFTHRLNS